MTSPRPDQLEQIVGELVQVATKLRDDYRWAYNIGYEPAGHGLDTSRTNHLSDPTGATTIHLRQFRYHSEAAAKATVAALSKLRDAAYHLAGAFDLVDRDTGYTPSEQTDYRPRLISHDELEQRRANQRRHQAQGDGWGNS
jgi:hypothetical protein